MRRYIFRVIVGASLLTLSASAAFAQNPPAAKQPGVEGQRRMGRVGREHRPGGPRGGQLGFLGNLNLSDTQREQLRQIESRYAANFRAKRDELHSIRQPRRQSGGGALTAEQEARARQLHEELRADAEKMRAEMRGLLTDEQRTQLQSMREEMQRRRDSMRERREDFRERRRQRRQQQTPPAPPADQL